MICNSLVNDISIKYNFFVFQFILYCLDFFNTIFNMVKWFKCNTMGFNYQIKHFFIHVFCVCFGHTTLLFIIKVKNVFLIKTRFYQNLKKVIIKDYAKLRFSSKTFNSFNNAILLFILISGAAQECVFCSCQREFSHISSIAEAEQAVQLKLLNISHPQSSGVV